MLWEKQEFKMIQVIFIVFAIASVASQSNDTSRYLNLPNFSKAVMAVEIGLHHNLQFCSRLVNELRREDFKDSADLISQLQFDSLRIEPLACSKFQIDDRIKMLYIRLRLFKNTLLNVIQSVRTRSKSGITEATILYQTYKNLLGSFYKMVKRFGGTLPKPKIATTAKDLDFYTKIFLKKRTNIKVTQETIEKFEI